MLHPRVLRRPRSRPLALLGLVALGVRTVASADSQAAATTSQRGPHNENYDPPIYAPTPSAPYEGTPGNPLVRRLGRLPGPGRDVRGCPTSRASAEQKALLDKIVQRPKATWFGALAARRRHHGAGREVHRADDRRRPRGPGPDAIFRMEPWERRGLHPPAHRRRAGVVQDVDRRLRGRRRRHPHGDHHAAGRPVRPVRAGRFEAAGADDQVRRAHPQRAPNTSVYIDAGAADWQRDDPKKALKMLIPMGIRWARGFALNSTHYDSTERQVRYSRRHLPGAGRARHARASTASSTPRRTAGRSRATSTAARTSTTPACARPSSDKRCVTLGIPPTVDVADPSGASTGTTAGSPRGTSTPTSGSAVPGSTTRPRRSCWTGRSTLARTTPY